MAHKEKAAVIGYGYVGKAVAKFLERSYEIVPYDPPLSLPATKDDANACAFAVICVPTPMRTDGAADLSYLEDVLSWLSVPLAIIKSTVPPGTTDRLAKGFSGSLCFSPEYIGEGNYPVPYWNDIPHATDMEKHSFHIFGGKHEAVHAAIGHWKRAGGPFPRYLETDAATAELTKYAENTWIATKITYVNELYDIARAFGVDYDELRELWLLDGRVGRSHTLVYEQKRGFDGKCIPKDTNGLVAAATAAGYAPELLASVLRVNEKFRAG